MNDRGGDNVTIAGHPLCVCQVFCITGNIRNGGVCTCKGEEVEIFRMNKKKFFFRL